MLDHVSYHACIRYLERVLRLPVAEWLRGREHLNEKLRAEHCCACAGVPVAAVRQAILCPALIGPILSNFDSVAVKFDGWVYIIRRGIVCTILTERMHDERTGRARPLKDFGRMEGRRNMAKTHRRMKARDRSRDRLEGAN